MARKGTDSVKVTLGDPKRKLSSEKAEEKLFWLRNSKNFGQEYNSVMMASKLFYGRKHGEMSG